MKRISSEEYFSKEPENLNCAQAVMKGFQDEFQVPDEIIERFQAFGGGRAKDGICGALYAANCLMKKRGYNALDVPFKEKIRYLTCEEIKQSETYSCEECIKTADDLILSELSKQNRELDIS